MKNNKGFGLVAILIIIVAVLAVGGVVYYVGKTSKTVPAVEENNFPQNTQNNFVNNREQNNPTNSDTTTAKDNLVTPSKYPVLVQPLNQAIWMGGNKYTISWTSATGEVEISACSTFMTNTGLSPQKCISIAKGQPSNGSYAYLLLYSSTGIPDHIEIKVTDSLGHYDKHTININKSSLSSTLGDIEG
jgi:hypothetical protein